MCTQDCIKARRASNRRMGQYVPTLNTGGLPPNTPPAGGGVLGSAAALSGRLSRYRLLRTCRLLRFQHQLKLITEPGNVPLKILHCMLQGIIALMAFRIRQ